jgi:uncharacterized damage-inducible protein DinB
MSDERKYIEMRLAAERARLLREFIGVDTHTLETVPVFADWTAANLLAHIGDYDYLFVERFKQVLDGKESEVASISDDGTPEDPLKKRNADLHARIKDWDLERSLEYFTDARIEFLNVLDKVSDEDIQRTRKFLWGEATMYDWTRWRWRHDEGHAEDVRRWRATLKTVDVPGAKNLAVEALLSARLDFVTSDAFVLNSERETRPVCGTWTLKDVCGHMADWDQYFANAALKMLGLEYEEIALDDDADKMNAQWADARREQSWEEIVEDFNDEFCLLWVTLDNANEEDFQHLSAGDDSPYPSVYHCAWSALEHYLDHAAVIRRELPVDDVPDRLKVFEGPYT